MLRLSFTLGMLGLHHLYISNAKDLATVSVPCKVKGGRKKKKGKGEIMTAQVKKNNNLSLHKNFPRIL